jgi:hypothetical protein
MQPNGLTIAKTLVKVSVVTDTAGGKKSVARRSTGLDYSSLAMVQRTQKRDKAVRHGHTFPPGVSGAVGG